MHTVNFSKIFIDRPIFASVLSILIVLVGSIAYQSLPLAQYPEVAPPTIVVRASYPGASPQVIAETVATPIEQEVNGVEDMLYMSSQSTSDGAMTLTITFKLGTDLDKAQVLVQNRVAIARAQTARRGPPRRCHHAEEVAGLTHGGPHGFAGRFLRPALYQQLRHPARARAAQAG